MDGQLVAMGERIPLVVVRGAEAQLLVVSNRTRDIRDHENRLDTDDALHSEIIGVTYLQLCPPPLRGTFANAGPAEMPCAYGRTMRPAMASGGLGVGGEELSAALVTNAHFAQLRTSVTASHEPVLPALSRLRRQLVVTARRYAAI